MPTKQKKKRKIGRPTLYKPEYCEMLIEHMSQGLSFESFGAEVNHHHQTLYEWAEKHKEFGEAKKKAFDKCRRFWEKLGIAGAAGRVKNFNAAVWIFNMKNRFRWHDRQVLVTEETDEGFQFVE